jgi:hypothetical protein
MASESQIPAQHISISSLNPYNSTESQEENMVNTDHILLSLWFCLSLRQFLS